MNNPTIGVSPSIHALIQSLAEKAELSPEVVVERALLRFREDLFWEECRAGYEALKATPEAEAEFRREAAAWDVTLGDGEAIDDARP